MIEVTEENAQKYHSYMWRWLARHVGYAKRDWPGWREIQNSNSHCFACMLADKRMEEFEAYNEDANDYQGGFAHCSVCPIKEWREMVTDGRKNNEPACLVYNSAYEKWETVWDDDEQSRLAIVISEMEWE